MFFFLFTRRCGVKANKMIQQSFSLHSHSSPFFKKTPKTRCLNFPFAYFSSSHVPYKKIPILPANEQCYLEVKIKDKNKRQMKPTGFFFN